ncbi:adenine phosphoribosyltransferase [Sphingorhabdus sp. Alg239-R122]|uniref:adenine phosphoribosyltransferase n=1 Tax=Sphingorhabdus sp. Alg239-R122 TaxID=2305989 RepID=UPI0013DB6A2E|nr:adenine phosphoribosyltransferase [Sphingorhabdus sp. Alg239-R122]
MALDDLKKMVRTVPDFPEAGIMFRDITTLIGNGEGFAATIGHLARLMGDDRPRYIAGMEARGFIFGAAVAVHLGIGFLPVRKPGKLPVETRSIDYALEYGTDRLEIAADAVEAGDRVVIIDDLIATGGTALATVRLLRDAGALVDKALFVIDLPELKGTTRLREANLEVQSLMEFEGE